MGLIHRFNLIKDLLIMNHKYSKIEMKLEQKYQQINDP